MDRQLGVEVGEGAQTSLESGYQNKEGGRITTEHDKGVQLWDSD